MLFKVLGPNRTPIHGGSGQWPEPGVWTETIKGDLVPCERGYHVCTLDQLSTWLREGCEVWGVEVGRKRVDAGDKVVVSRARLVRRLPFDWAEYARQTAALRAEYYRQTAPLWAEYARQAAPLLAEYDRQTAPLRAEYDRQTAALLAGMLGVEGGG